MYRLTDHEQIMLEHHVAIGNVTKKPHPSTGLWIYNYSKQCQFEGNWDFHTLRARGLILDYDYNIVARGMNKFFNYGEELAPKWTENTIVSAVNKLDGSLGILYANPETGKQCIATRGSFTSEQALKATGLLHRKYPNWTAQTEITYLFEIIYPENRIVLDYGDEEDLHLLGIVFNETGEFIPANYASWGWPGPRAELAHPNITFGDLLKLGDRPNAEGYVVRDLQGRMAKVKQDDYVQLSRMLTSLTPYRIWWLVNFGKEDINKYISGLPELPAGIAQGLLDDLNKKREELLLEGQKWTEIYRDLATTDGVFSRKEFAMYARQDPLSGLIFFILDGFDTDSVTWKMVKP